MSAGFAALSPVAGAAGVVVAGAAGVVAAGAAGVVAAGAAVVSAAGASAFLPQETNARATSAGRRSALNFMLG